MNFNQLIFLLSFAFCFLGCFVGFSMLVNSSAKDSAYSSRLTYAIFYGVNLLAFVALVVFKPQTFDFITNPDALNLLLPMVASGLLFGLLPFLHKQSLKLLLVVLLAAAVVWLTPNNVVIFNEQLPLWLNQIFSFILLVAIARSVRYFNGISGLLGLETFTVALGVFLLSLIGGVPFLLGTLALCVASSTLAFLVFNWHPSRLKLGEDECDSLGFLMGWLVLATSFEGAGSCVYIFATFFVVEIVGAWAKKLTFFEAFRDVYANTVYYEVAQKGLSEQEIGQYVFKANVILLMFGCFQVFAPNPYSLPLLATVVMIWNVVKLKNGSPQSTSLREVNKQFYSDIKQEVGNIKKYLKKDE